MTPTNTDPLVDRLAAVLHRTYCCTDPNHLTGDDWDGAHEVIEALASAGRLLPDGGETHTEWVARWGVDLEFEHPLDSREHADNFVDGGLRCGTRVAVEQREVREWPDGSVFTGPWVEVTDAST